MGLFNKKRTDYNVVNFVDTEFKNVNSFLIVNKERKGILIDCWKGSANEINQYIKDNEIVLEHIFLGHGHYEHINGFEKVYIENSDAQVHIAAVDLPNLYDADLNLSAMYDVEKFVTSKNVKNINAIMEDKEFNIHGLKIRVFIRTAHTKGSLIFVIDDLKLVFTGDTVFCSARTTVFDETLADEWDESVRWLFKKIPKDYIIMPGHHEYGIDLKSVLKNNEQVKEIFKKKK